ncbi:hypothetical protein [Nocardia iowensis]|uniref:Uncharacterized protein n=1 Tax=Nocardia iowensis TaxID=204891 RepID=A0ABX8RPT9_NOCIO|nr:hypothetical protein [Nocardia iowensis]QXN90305.1 hypothetical protein KV110_33585 [Nocardia iowensis]
MNHRTPDRKVVDDIDALVDEQLAQRPDSGTAEGCPHCPSEWHALPIRMQLLVLRLRYCGCEDCEAALDAYDYASDDSPVFCPGSQFYGPLQPLHQRLRGLRGLIPIRIEIIDVADIDAAQADPPPGPVPPDGCAYRIPFPASADYRAQVWAYRLSRPWREANYVFVSHAKRSFDDDGPEFETAIFRYHPPGTPQPRVTERFYVDGHWHGVLAGEDISHYQAAIDHNGVIVEVDPSLRARFHADGRVDPDLFVQQVTGQMVVAIVE